MPLDLDDGYTLPFATAPTLTDPATGDVIAANLPVVTGRYRPALFEEIQRYRYALSRAASGAEQAAVIADMIASHVTDWDVRNRGVTAAVDPKVIRERVPEPIVSQLLNVVLTWAPREQEAAEKN